MKQSNLSAWLKTVAVIVGIMGLLLFFLIFPISGHDIAEQNPDIAFMYWPCMIYLWIMAVPCYVALWQFWRIAVEIGRDNSFCHANVIALEIIGRMSLLDTILLFSGSAVIFIIKALTPAVLLAIVFICILGIAMSVLCAALSHLVEKAASLKEENDLTI